MIVFASLTQSMFTGRTEESPGSLRRTDRRAQVREQVRARGAESLARSLVCVRVRAYRRIGARVVRACVFVVPAGVRARVRRSWRDYGAFSRGAARPLPAGACSCVRARVACTCVIWQ
jgi:hypothetical protein